MNKFEYKKLTPFKWFVLENFPFIEADFDALTEWQLFCKLGKEINKVINSTNTLGTQVENLTTFVTNYFDNLDVQEEVNAKLNEMAQDGTLAQIINQEIFTDLNNKVINLENKMEEIRIFVDNFKENTDIDDTESIKRAIEYARNFRNPTLFFTKDEYYVSDYFEIDYKLNIDFNDATIYFENNNIDLNGDAKAIFWYKTNMNVGYQTVLSDLNENTNIFQANLQNVNLSDYLVLRFRDNSGRNELSSEQYYLTQVKNINDNNFTLDYILGYDFKTLGYEAELGKPTQVLKDIYVRNGKIVDNSNTIEDNSTMNGITFLRFLCKL